jgi:hypothetical protein
VGRARRRPPQAGSTRQRGPRGGYSIAQLSLCAVPADLMHPYRTTPYTVNGNAAHDRRASLHACAATPRPWGSARSSGRFLMEPWRRRRSRSKKKGGGQSKRPPRLQRKRQCYVDLTFPLAFIGPGSERCCFGGPSGCCYGSDRPLRRDPFSLSLPGHRARTKAMDGNCYASAPHPSSRTAPPPDLRTSYVAGTARAPESTVLEQPRYCCHATRGRWDL